MIVAMVIDDTFANWAIGILGVAVPTIGTTGWMLWRQFISFITPKVTKMFDAHTGLVTTMEENVPKVAATLEKLGETQEKQRETLDLHTRRLDHQIEILGKHGEKIDTILDEVRKSNPGGPSAFRGNNVVDSAKASFSFPRQSVDNLKAE